MPESAFLQTLDALKDLSDFEQRTSIVNEHGQSLLHLAVYLRYYGVVQRLVDWGIDLNAKDVNGYTALDAAFLCNDSFIVHILEKRGASALVLDGLGRPPTNKIALDHNHPAKGEKQKKRATMYLNEYKQNRVPHSVDYYEYECGGVTERGPLWGCRVYVDCVLRGHSEIHTSKRNAREAAAYQAAEALCLVDNVETRLRLETGGFPTV